MRQHPIASPGVVLRAANPKSNDCRGQSHHNSKLSGHRLFGTDDLTEEECGRRCSDLGNVKTYTEGAVLVVTPLEVCDVVLACRFPPEFLSRPPSGATLSPGEGIGKAEISCAIVRFSAVYQEIATSGFALLAMTW